MSATLDDLHAPLPWQASAWQALCARLADGRLPHALLISGVAGLGKERFARDFAQLALCRTPAADRACGQCHSCREFLAGAHPDWQYVGIEEERSAILVDQIRALSANLSLTSQHGGRKLALIAPADAMNTAAANSLLKTLEEPPPDTILLLVTARAARLPATVRSRCQVLPLPAPARQEAVRWLKARQPRDDWTALLGIAGGGPLLAWRLAQDEFISRRLEFFGLLAEVRAGRRDPLAAAAELARADLPLVLRLLQAWVMDLIVLRSGNPSASLINTDARPLLQTADQGLHWRGLHAYLSRVQAAVNLSATPVNRQLLVESLLLDWAEGLTALQTTPLAAGGGFPE